MLSLGALTGLTTVVMATVLAPGQPGVGARSAQCGDVLTANTTLSSDLVCPNDIALTIGASNVTLDLGGHTVTTNTPTTTGTGVAVRGGSAITNITIQNGKVTRYSTGIDLADASGVVVAGVESSSSSSAGYPPSMLRGADITGKGSRDVQLRDATLGGAVPFRFSDSSTVTIVKSTISTTASQSGSRCAASSCVISDSTIRTYTIWCDDWAFPAASLVIENSTLNVFEAGRGCRNTTIKNSRVDHGGRSEYSGNELLFTGNVVTGDTVTTRADTSYAVTGNSFSNMRIGLQVGNGYAGVTKNTFARNEKAGLLVLPEGWQASIHDNTFTANGRGGPPGDGMEPGGLIEPVNVQRRVRIGNNRAEDNVRYGIWAHGAVIDAGGNTSSGDELGCLGVRCLPPPMTSQGEPVGRERGAR